MDQNYRHTDISFESGPIKLSVNQYNKSADEAEPTQLSMEGFLAEIEKRAYHMAAFATGCHADALDLLQESMIKLVTNYAERPSDQWKPLLYKILQNKIRDYHRHQKVKNLVFFWKSNDKDNGDEPWPPTSAGADTWRDTPEADIAKSQQQLAALEHLKQLSDKQRESFLLRSWEGLSTAQTAEIMGCSEGSVKTHYSRAVAKLKSLLEAEHDITF